MWSKDGRQLDVAASTWHRRWNDDDVDDGQSSPAARLRLMGGGTLVFSAASTADEGVYKCLLYSPLRHDGPESPSVRVLVRGKYSQHPEA